LLSFNKSMAKRQHFPSFGRIFDKILTGNILQALQSKTKRLCIHIKTGYIDIK